MKSGTGYEPGLADHLAPSSGSEGVSSRPVRVSMSRRARWLPLALLALAIASSARPQGLPFVLTTLSYGEDAAQVLDLYIPAGAPEAPVPAVVMAHGGLWGGGERSYLQSLCMNVIIESGGEVACASIDYRLSASLGGVCTAPGVATYFDQLGDMASAFALLRREAGAYGLDPARLYVGGHSAGAHLAQTLNLRWAEFGPACTHSPGCPAPAGAIGFEGIYDIAAWDAYDASFWEGRYFCATRQAFGAPPGSSPACLDLSNGLPCWQAGSPTYLASNHAELGIEPAGDALVIHAPDDDWVDIREATRLGAALGTAFPEKRVVTSIDGTCATGTHYSPITQPSLARCIASFVAPERFGPIPVPFSSPAGAEALAISLLAGLRRVGLGRVARERSRREFGKNRQAGDQPEGVSSSSSERPGGRSTPTTTVGMGWRDSPVRAGLVVATESTPGLLEQR